MRRQVSLASDFARRDASAHRRSLPHANLRPMTKRKHASALVEAAQQLDDALEAHARAAELFTRTPLTSTKHIERANELLGEIAGAEEILRERGAALAQAVSDARDRQEQLAQDILARLPLIQERNALLQQLLTDFQLLGGEAATVNATASGSNPKDLAASLLALAERATALAVRAHDADFEELASQAHALHQKLGALAKKLQGVTL